VSSPNLNALVAFTALTLWLGGRKDIRPVENGRMLEIVDIIMAVK